MEDNSDVLRETKAAQTNLASLSSHSLNVEISLKTKEGESMLLEVWTMAMDTFHRKPVKVGCSCVAYISVPAAAFPAVSEL